MPSESDPGADEAAGRRAAAADAGSPDRERRPGDEDADRRAPDAGRRTPDADRRTPDAGRGSAAPDGGTSPGFDERALYHTVRRAVEDAILNAVGTLLLVGIGLLFVASGGQVLVRADGTFGYGLGVAILAFGCYLAAAAVGVVPSAREWLRR